MKLSAHRFIVFLLLAILSGLNLKAMANDQPILIGATASLEGKYEEPSLMIQQAYKMWVEEVNQGGGILKRTVKLILYDDKSNPDLAKELYRRLIEEDKVDLVFSPYGTPLTLAASEVSEQHGYTMLASGSAGNTPWQRGYKFLFGMYAPADRFFIGTLEMMVTKGYRTLSLIYDETSAFNLDVAAGVQQWADKFKIKILFLKGYKDGNAELPGITKDLKATDANGLIISAYTPDCHEFLRQLNLHNYRPPIIGMTIAPGHPDFQKNVGEIADKIFSPTQWEPDERIPFPGTKKFIGEFQKFTGRMPSFHAGSAYAACQIFEQAILHSGSLDNLNIRNYISALDTVTVIGRFKVDPSGKQIGHNSFTIQWQNGKKEIVWPSKMQTAKPLF